MNLKALFNNLLRTSQPAEQDNSKRPYQVAQIEITSRCSSACVFCPQEALREDWVAQELPIDVYREAIAPHLGLFEIVYLQGWGEPLHHPHLWEMLKMARTAGCRTGFTTNGVALHAEKIERTFEEKVDIISISLAGASESRHGSLRRGSPWRLILSNLERLVKVRTSRGLKSPWIELHFLMMRSNICELPEFVRLAADIGVDEVVATNLTATPSHILDKMRVFDWYPEDAHLEALEETRCTAERLGVKLRTYPLKMNADVISCAAQPETIVYITSRGEIAPCVYLGMNVVGDIRRTFLGETYTVSRMIFGDVRDGMDIVMDASVRRDFLAAWRARQAKAHTWGNLAVLSRSENWDLPPVPSACETCYKRYGV